MRRTLALALGRAAPFAARGAVLVPFAGPACLAVFAIDAWRRPPGLRSVECARS